MGTLNAENELLNRLNPLLLEMGYELVAIEVLLHREKTLRVFIDRMEPSQGVAIEDCVRVTHALDPWLDQEPLMEQIFGGPYELEVSSPGVERPLRKPSDFSRFAGRLVRVHLFRPLSGDELGNASYADRNPKQKNFFGTLKGFENERVLLQVDLAGGIDQKGKKKAKKKKLSKTEKDQAETLVTLPLDLISKAHLEPVIDL